MTTAVYEFLFETLTMKAVGIVLGLALLCTHSFAFAKRDTVQAALKLFPRNRRSGVVLTIINALFAFVLMSEIDMGEFFHLRNKILIVIPVAAFLVIRFCDEFLAVRALGALLLLLAAPILDCAFLQPQATRLLLPILAYGWIIKGLVWVGLPYLMRDSINWVIARQWRWTACCFAGIGYGAALLIAAILTY
jgi:hypothetical protein